MSDTKLLQAIASRIASMDKKMDDGFKEMKEGFKNVNERLDMQSKSLAYLEDDAPTIKSHNNLKKRVKRLEDTVFKII